MLNTIKVVEFVVLHDSEGGEIHVREYEVSSDMDESRFDLYNSGIACDEYDVVDEDIFTASKAYSSNKQKWTECFEQFKKLRNGEKLLDVSVEYDVSICFVQDNRIDEVQGILADIMHADVENDKNSEDSH